MDKLQELKAQAYDIISNIEYLQAKLRQINAAIAEETKKQQDNGRTDNSNNSN